MLLIEVCFLEAVLIYETVFFYVELIEPIKPFEQILKQ